MASRFNNKLAEWAAELANGMSLRAVEVKTGIAYSTVKGLLEGRSIGADTLIRFASSFHQPVAPALRLAGYDDIADLWQARSEAEENVKAHAHQSLREARSVYGEPDDVTEEEWEVLIFYRGIPTADKSKAKRVLQAMREEDDDSDDLPTFGRGRGARK